MKPISYHIESIHKALKKDYVWSRGFQNAEEAEVTLLEVLDDYNRNKIHSAIGYETPDEFVGRWEKENQQGVANR